MKRKNSNSEDEPQAKKQKLLFRYENGDMNKCNNSFFTNHDYCDVTFCIHTMHNDKNDQVDAKGIDVEEIANYKEYPCFKQFFAPRSKYFKAILFDNQNVDINTKITLDDLDCNTFEFLRDWCYQNKTLFLDKNNVLNILSSSFKYQINILFKQCIDYIRNKWIVDCESLMHFFQCVNNTIPHIRKTIIYNLPRVLNDNEIVKENSVRFYDKIECGAWSTTTYIDILMCLIECNSLYLRPEKIWEMCQMFWQSCCDEMIIRCGFCHCKRLACNIYFNESCRSVACSTCLDFVNQCNKQHHILTEMKDSGDDDHDDIKCRICNSKPTQRNKPFFRCCSFAQDICHDCKDKLQAMKTDDKRKHVNNWTSSCDDIDIDIDFDDKDSTQKFCTLGHQLTEHNDDDLCKFCFANVLFCAECNDRDFQFGDHHQSGASCNGENCKILYKKEVSLMKSIFSRLFSSNQQENLISLQDMSLPFLLRHVVPVLQRFKLVDDSMILKIIIDKNKQCYIHNY